ncbi:acyl transferase domain-containing protein [Actinokineospora baliensis]|uniref:type I polyketide synthase n=1 Tax=Actinokineospora baliensis TaxID=547056 RepID=UPI00195C30DB|nr:type I polyketide synthase [Actinokineospora baliensis]MBM7769830.1 acyl transferase domain-containing protein [Actinokineospora baliensis]
MADDEKLLRYLKRVTADLADTRERLAALREPVAVVGMGCRYPGGVRTPEDLWDLVRDGRDAVTGFPDGRGIDADPVAVRGGFLDDADRFDAALFGISPREALTMDPQQRVLLEVAWEALERAGIDPLSLRGSRTGVFAGAGASNYGIGLELPEGAEGHLLTGSAASVVSGRVAYALGLEGPAVTVDTACSSSLVALHLAVKALQADECSVALAAGVTVMAGLGLYSEFGAQGGLAGDGRCKAFSADADGTGWGEGAGVLVLTRLSEARRRGYEVLAVVSGTAVNADGASNGLTAPNGPSQQRVIRAALTAAGLTPSDVDAVEAHGTGTVLGDPIEAQALAAAYGRDRAEPLWLGSIKSNIGHTQAAAGVAGVIKSVLALRHGELPMTLHAEEPSPHIDWTGLRLLTASRSWPQVDRPRRIGVSSFGMSGTNAHAILSSVDSEPAAAGSAPALVPCLVSAHTPEVLREQAHRLLGSLDGSVLDVGHTLATARAALEHRAVVLAADRDGLVDGLRAIAAGRPAGTVVAGTADDGRTAFLFTGQGAQRAGMGERLAAAFSVFADAHAEVLSRFGELGDLDRTEHAQPAIFAFEVALFRLLQSWGIRPDYLVGHSIGEIAAAHVAGILSLDDACTLVSARARLMGALPEGGAMLAIEAAESEIELPEGVDLAAVNSDRSIVVSGDCGIVQQFKSRIVEQGRRVKDLAVSHAFHSRLMDPMLPEFRAALAGVTFTRAALPVVSSVSGELLVDAPAEYWVQQVRQPVRFATAVDQLRAAGVTKFVEVGPDGALSAMVDGAVALSRRDRDEVDALLTGISRAHVAGVPVDWRAVFEPWGGRVVPLPTYAFRRDRYWLAAATTDADTSDNDFWSTVDRADPTALAAALRTDEDAVRAVLPALLDWRRGVRDRAEVDTWSYRATWTPLTGLAPRAPGTWLVVVPSAKADDKSVISTVRALRGHGVDVVELPLARTEVDRWSVAARLRDIAGMGFTAVLSLLADDSAPHTEYPPMSAGQVANLILVQALGDAAIDAPLWMVTRGAVSVGRADRLTAPGQAQLWGMGRVAALELGARWGGVVDMPNPDDRAVAALLAVVSSGEDQVAIRSTGVFGRRLVRATPPVGTPWSPRGTVLVTGGTGALGTHVAQWLTERGAEKVILASRGSTEFPLDVADREQVAAFVAGHEIGTVVHAAGVSDLVPLNETGLAEFADVLRAKVEGAALLDELLPKAEFVYFSSVAATWGGGGQGAYAAANAYLDALAESRRARGLPAVSVAWGPWEGAGMAAQSHDQLLRRGLRPMSPVKALTALGRTLDSRTDLTVADVDWTTFAPAFTSTRPSRLLADLPEAADTTPVDAGDLRAQWRTRLADLPEGDRTGVLLDLVRAEVAAVLGYRGPEDIGAQLPFKDLGVDSLTAVEVRDRLATATGLALTAGLVFDYPKPASLAEYLAAELTGTTREVETTARIATDEPIAIIGMACRFPGGIASPEDLWRLLLAGDEAISAFPTDRGWDLAELFAEDADGGTSYVQAGGFLHEAADFDPAFFGISPREAIAMDPQQRLLLETAWEAVERAGIDPHDLRGSRTGVFAGSNGQDYSYLLLSAEEDVEGHLLAGATASILSGRVAYTLGFEGPALTVDTACSSSLVALHLAARSLRSGECDLALAGGVSVMSTPGPFVEFSRLSGLAQDGRCKAFADAADGTGWGEGAALLLVERLSDAQRNGHQVLAVVRGSAVNSDGASNGLTAPNGPSQQRVIREAVAAAGLSLSDVDAVEAHGTGTTLGDPIEAQALLATYGRDRERPLLLGAVKSNLGHTQAASGAAGVIKMVMALRHGILPKTLHIDAPTTQVDWTAGAVDLLTDTTPWPATGRPRRAGVSSFGASGTNAHLVVEEAVHVPGDPAEQTTSAAGRPLPFVVSARSEQALRAQAEALRANLTDALPDVAHTLSRRSTFEHRAVVVADSTDSLREGLSALVDATPHPAVTAGKAGTAKVAFVFPGQGSQWAGMALDLLTEPVFADRFAECAHALAPHIDFVPTEALADEDALARVDVVQPLLWAVMVSLAALWQAHGVAPAAVVGHSQGEIAAAAVAGALSLADAAAVVALRSQAITELAGLGGMVSIPLSEGSVCERIEGWGERISVAAVNGPEATVVSGEPGALDELLVALTGDNVRARRVPVDYASHSAQVDRLRARILGALAEITPRRCAIPFYSAVTGDVVDTTKLDAEYWFTNLRETVRFEAATTALLRDGHTLLIESSPHPVLTAAIQDATAIGTLRRDDGGRARWLTALAEAHTRGAAVDWRLDGRFVDLPTYAFQRQRFWPKARPEAPAVVSNPGEARFWAAVDRQDSAVVSSALRVPETAVEPLLPALASWHRQVSEESAVDAWRYRIRWSAVDEVRDPVLTGRWLVVVTQAVADSPVVKAMAGAEVLVVDPTEESFVAQLLGREVDGVLSLLALDETPHPVHTALPVGLTATLSLLHAVVETDIAPLWCVTQGAVGTTGEVPARPVQAQVWGLGRVAGLEHPRQWGGLVDVPVGFDDRAASRLVGVLSRADDEDQLAIRASGTFARRLVRAATGSAAPMRSWRPGGTVLVTGGTGAIGGHVSRWLAANGAEHLVLTSRRGPAAPGARELVAELSASGARVDVVSCDLADRADVARMLSELDSPVTAVMHTAGMGTLAPLEYTSVDDLAYLITAKVAGARHLDELIDPAQLDAVVYFSSIAGVWGVGRHGGYAAGNAYLDALAEHRRSEGVPVLSVAWGPWDGGGMVALTAVEPMLRRGVPLITPGPAMVALRQALDHGDTFVAAAEVDWARFVPAFTSLRPSPLLAELPEAAQPVATAVVPAEAAADFRSRMAGLSEVERSRALLDLVRAHAAVVLGHTGADAIEPDRAFREVGFDSLTAVELRNRLAADTGLALPATLVFDQPNPTVLATHLRTLVLPDTPEDDLPSMAELDRLELALTTRPDDDIARVRVVMRLESLLAAQRATAASTAGDLLDRLGSATNDELFDLVEKDLGLT